MRRHLNQWAASNQVARHITEWLPFPRGTKTMLRPLERLAWPTTTNDRTWLDERKSSIAGRRDQPDQSMVVTSQSWIGRDACEV
jgi:hypothetical protein